MSSENVFGIPQPLPLIRSLSTQHWVAASTEMAQKRRKVQPAGFATDYEYQVVRENTKTRNVTEQTLYKGDIVCCVSNKLPKAHRCLGRNKSGQRCKLKVYGFFCKNHVK